MTPRRVKRRSVSRGSGRHSRSSQRSRRSHANPSGYNTGTSLSNGMVNEAYSGTMSGVQNGTLTSTTRSTGRESLRKKRYTNPVNRLMDESSTSNDSMPQLPAYFPSSHPNGGYPPPPPVNRDRFPNRSGPPPTSRPPAMLPPHPAGHSNPLYQSSRANSVYSVSANVDLDYRPPSAHSSYSNWHGQRGAMPLPANGHSSNNLHGHSPTPSTATTNTFGVPSTTYDVGNHMSNANGYSRSAVHQSDYGSRSGYDQGKIHSKFIFILRFFFFFFQFNGFLNIQVITNGSGCCHDIMPMIHRQTDASDIKAYSFQSTAIVQSMDSFNLQKFGFLIFLNQL